MKLLFIIIFILSIFSSISAQSPCPKISVVGPSGLTAIGDSMTFTANIKGISLDKVKFEWIVTNGTIISGQETSAISIATDRDMAGQTITAFVKIYGLSQNCVNEAAGSGEVAAPINCGSPRTLDEYGKILWRDEKIRLDNLVVELKNDDNAMLLFMIWTKEKSWQKNLQTIKIQEAKIKKYLFDKHKITKDRIRFVNAGYGDNSVRIYIMPIIPRCQD